MHHENRPTWLCGKITSQKFFFSFFIYFLFLRFLLYFYNATQRRTKNIVTLFSPGEMHFVLLTDGSLCLPLSLDWFIFILLPFTQNACEKRATIIYIWNIPAEKHLPKLPNRLHIFYEITMMRDRERKRDRDFYEFIERKCFNRIQKKNFFFIPRSKVRTSPLDFAAESRTIVLR